MHTQETKKTVQEAEAPVVNKTVDYGKVDTNPDRERPMGRAYFQLFLLEKRVGELPEK